MQKFLTKVAPTCRIVCDRSEDDFLGFGSFSNHIVDPFHRQFMMVIGRHTFPMCPGSVFAWLRNETVEVPGWQVESKPSQGGPLVARRYEPWPRLELRMVLQP